MFNELIKIALKSALQNPEIKDGINRENKKNQGRIIDLDKNNYMVVDK